MAQQPFGGDPTKRKLDVIEKYLRAYQKALRKFDFEKVYIDAFAGTGEIPGSKPGSEEGLFDHHQVQDVIVGSAVRALELEIPFDRYIFIDQKPDNLDELASRLKGHSNFSRCEFVDKDANLALPQLCSRFNWRRTRAVTFLDPFGNQVAWETVEALSKTNTDLWYLFPSGIGVFRQISKGGTVHSTHEASLDRLFGTREWRNAFLKVERSEDLFGHADRRERVVTPEIAASYMQKRMSDIFAGVLPEKLPLGKHAYPSFHLLFAWANDSEATRKLATRLGRAVIKAAEK